MPGFYARKKHPITGNPANVVRSKLLRGRMRGKANPKRKAPETAEAIPSARFAR